MSQGYLKLCVSARTKSISLPPLLLYLLLLLYPYFWEGHHPPSSYPRQFCLLFYPPINHQVLLILLPIYICVCPLSFMHTVTLLLRSISPHAWVTSSATKVVSLVTVLLDSVHFGYCSQVIFPKHKADLVVHLLNTSQAYEGKAISF